MRYKVPSAVFVMGASRLERSAPSAVGRASPSGRVARGGGGDSIGSLLTVDYVGSEFFTIDDGP